MTEDSQNCIQDQIARMNMMNSTTEIPPSGYLTSNVLSYNDGVTTNKNEDIFPTLDTSNWPMTCGIKLEHLSKPSFATIDFTHPSPQKHPFFQLVDKVVNWHYDRNLIDGSTDKDQTLKLAQELGELSDSVCKGKDIRDDIGDMLVVMLNIAERNGVSLDDCLERAWDDIKDRKGKMIDGIFVKESDL